jgi:hypothetical protein
MRQKVVLIKGDRAVAPKIIPQIKLVVETKRHVQRVRFFDELKRQAKWVNFGERQRHCVLREKYGAFFGG